MQKKINKIKRESLWLKIFLAIETKNLSEYELALKKVDQYFLKQDIFWSTFIGFV